MAVISVRSGVAFNIYAWGTKHYCQLVEFLADLKSNDSSEYDKIWSRITRAADHGPPTNPQQCRSLEGKGAEGLYELKSSGGIRVAWFYDKNRLIVCTHAFNKPTKKELKLEIQKAQSIRTQYFREKQNA